MTRTATGSRTHTNAYFQFNYVTKIILRECMIKQVVLCVMFCFSELLELANMASQSGGEWVKPRSRTVSGDENDFLAR